MPAARGSVILDRGCPIMDIAVFLQAGTHGNLHELSDSTPAPQNHEDYTPRKPFSFSLCFTVSFANSWFEVS